LLSAALIARLRVRVVVRHPGLEPGWVTPHAPQACASTSSASRPAEPVDFTRRSSRPPLPQRPASAGIAPGSIALFPALESLLVERSLRHREQGGHGRLAS